MSLNLLLGLDLCNLLQLLLKVRGKTKQRNYEVSLLRFDKIKLQLRGKVVCSLLRPQQTNKFEIQNDKVLSSKAETSIISYSRAMLALSRSL